MDITHLRKEYCQAGLSRKDLEKEPHQQFDKWFKQAHQAGIEEPNAMSLATVNGSGVPSCRTVLLKLYDQKGFVFFTNYHSEKARDIYESPYVALLFPWLQLERQVRITGVAEKISPEESLHYFSSRPRGSQIGAWASPQSKIIESRAALSEKQRNIEERFDSQDIPLPDHWGGYRVVPNTYEFWQGRSSRLHDRFIYEEDYDKTDVLTGHITWTLNRLAP